MLKPLLFDLQRAMDTVSCKTRAMEARALMTSVDIMLNSVLKWLKGTPNIENEEVTKCQVGTHLTGSPFALRDSPLACTQIGA